MLLNLELKIPTIIYNKISEYLNFLYSALIDQIKLIEEDEMTLEKWSMIVAIFIFVVLREVGEKEYTIKNY